MDDFSKDLRSGLEFMLSSHPHPDMVLSFPHFKSSLCPSISNELLLSLLGFREWTHSLQSARQVLSHWTIHFLYNLLKSMINILRHNRLGYVVNLPSLCKYVLLWKKIYTCNSIPLNIFSYHLWEGSVSLSCRFMQVWILLILPCADVLYTPVLNTRSEERRVGKECTG